MKKTRLMLQAESQIGQPLEMALPGLLGEHGATETAVILDVSKSTIGYWMLKLGIRVERVAVTAQDKLVVHRFA